MKFVEMTQVMTPCQVFVDTMTYGVVIIESKFCLLTVLRYSISLLLEPSFRK
jgi:hypothetical protein